MRGEAWKESRRDLDSWWLLKKQNITSFVMVLQLQHILNTAHILSKGSIFKVELGNASVWNRGQLLPVTIDNAKLDGPTAWLCIRQLPTLWMHHCVYFSMCGIQSMLSVTLNIAWREQVRQLKHALAETCSHTCLLPNSTIDVCQKQTEQYSGCAAA